MNQEIVNTAAREIVQRVGHLPCRQATDTVLSDIPVVSWAPLGVTSPVWPQNKTERNKIPTEWKKILKSSIWYELITKINRELLQLNNKDKHRQSAWTDMVPKEVHNEKIPSITSHQGNKYHKHNDTTLHSVEEYLVNLKARELGQGFRHLSRMWLTLVWLSSTQGAPNTPGARLKSLEQLLGSPGLTQKHPIYIIYVYIPSWCT